MRLNSLQLVNFRNYNNLYLEFNKKVNLLLGKNGQGKTNIVESIYMLSFGKSFRTSRDKAFKKGKSFFTLLNSNSNSFFNPRTVEVYTKEWKNCLEKIKRV